MNQKQRNQIQSLLEELEFVDWDRFITYSDWNYGEIVTLYGWIPREQDSYKDFVVVNLECLEDSDVVKVGASTTSSEKYTEKVHDILYGEDTDHNQCKRVENHFDVNNTINLQGENHQ